RSMPDGGLATIGWANWLPDGKTILFAASAPGVKSRLYVQNISGGSPAAISPEGYGVEPSASFVSPDGRQVFARNEQGRAVLFPTEGGPSAAPPELLGLGPDET